MNYIELFTEVSIICSFAVQLLKERLPKIPNNILTLICSIIIGSLSYLGVTQEQIDASVIVLIQQYGIKAIMFGVACGFGSMVGYDKIKQCFKQFDKINNIEENKDDEE